MRRMPALGLLLLLSSLAWQSCQQQSAIANHTFETGCWEIDDTLSFSLHPSQLSQESLNVEVTFLPEYRYANLYLKLLLTDPNGRQQEYLVNDTVIDPAGNWLSPFTGGTIAHVFAPAIGIKLQEAGVHQAQLIQYMREQSLCEIQSVRVW